MALPVYRSADLPGTGGVLRAGPEDFRVEEIPAYGPCGEGEHVLATIEKVDLTTNELCRRLAAALAVRPDAIGFAGQKDRHAVTVQQLSLPRPVTPEQVLAISLPGVRVLSAARHKNKLKLGHLHGNRFVLTIRQLAMPADQAAAAARAVLECLARPPGVPNWYDAQRFGVRGDNAERGLALLRGETLTPPPRDGREKRFLLNAWQSSCFNAYLEERLKDGTYSNVIAGDILQKTTSSACFASPDPAVDQLRLDAGEVAPTGPMFGSRLLAPAEGSDAAARETRLLAAVHLNPDALRRAGLDGTRRPLGILVRDPAVRACAPDAIEVAFRLPPGSYATVVAAEIMKPASLLPSPPEDPACT